MADIFIGRQPIFDRKLNIYGYELLFRTGKGNTARLEQLGADSATSMTIFNSFVEMGLEKLVRGRYAFINLTEKFLLDVAALPMDSENVVLEISEDIHASDEVLSALKRLKERGFVIALDNYIYKPANRALLPFADIIKLDIMKLSERALVAHINLLKKFNILLAATKIEDVKEFLLCQKLGFDYFQGYFLSKPKTIKSKSLPSNKLAILNLLGALQNPESDIEEIEEAISMDASISYKLLKLINSAKFNLRSKVDSIRQAGVLIGRKQLCSWASMMALASMQDRPPEMMHMTLIRAKMCELLAENAGLPEPETYFTVGMLSALDILMERELHELLYPLPLSREVKYALLNHRGDRGEALKCVLANEVNDYDNIKFKELAQDVIYDANVEAITWANLAIDL